MHPVFPPRQVEPFDAFWGLRLRAEGRLTPAHRVHWQPWAYGRLSLAEERHGGRHVLVARFRSALGGPEVFPSLLEARLVEFHAEHLLLAGLELDQLNGRAWAQAWKLVAPDQAPNECSELAGEGRAVVPELA